MIAYDTLSEAIAAKQKEGYRCDFNLYGTYLECELLNEKFMVDEFIVDSFYRFEGRFQP